MAARACGLHRTWRTGPPHRRVGSCKRNLSEIQLCDLEHAAGRTPDVSTVNKATGRTPDVNDMTSLPGHRGMTKKGAELTYNH